MAIAVVGKSHEEINRLIAQITGHIGEFKINNHQKFELITKYYRANLEFYPLFLQSDIHNNHLISEKKWEGVIFIPSNDNTDLNSPEYALISSMHEIDSISLRLITTVPSDLLSEEKFRLIYQMWALDYGYEWIELVNENETNEQIIINNDYDNREKVGLSRVMEALQSNMWSNMIKIKKESQSKPMINTNVVNDNNLVKLNDIEVNIPSLQLPITTQPPVTADLDNLDHNNNNDNNINNSIQNDSTIEYDLDLLPDSEENSFLDKYSDFINQ
eukprot:gene15114-20334_t